MDQPDGSMASPDAAPIVRAPELGTGDKTAASVTLTEIAGSAARLNDPRDLAFNPLRPDELWVVNNGDNSVTLVHGADQDGRITERRLDGYALHFLARPAALAFGGNDTTFGKMGTFATCGESRNDYDNMAAPNDFMGPALWSSDLTVFAKSNPNGLGTHLDMLHCSPLCMGIAHETANVYWAFDGLANAIVKYDFVRDDGIGNDNHSDGRAYKYVTGMVKYARGIPSHMAFDPSSGLLYIADTGNKRIAKLDTRSGSSGSSIGSLEPMAEYRTWNGATLTDVVPAASAMLDAPSGLELKNQLLYVSDNRTGRISAFTLEGEQVNYLDTGLGAGALGGMAFGPDNKLYLVDMLNDRVVRIDPTPAQ